MTEHTQEQGKEEPEQLAETVSSALRGSKYGIFEQLVCQHLIQAVVSSDSLRKTQLVCEAALMIEPEKQKALGIDIDKVLTVHLIGSALSEPNEYKAQDGHNSYPVVSIKFGFEETQENFDKHINQWLKLNDFEYYSGLITRNLKPAYKATHSCGYVFGVFPKDPNEAELAKVIKTDQCPKCYSTISFYSRRFYHCRTEKVSVVSTEPYYSFFYEATKYLSPQGYFKLKHSFLNWCFPFVMDTMRRLTEGVKPEIYNQIAKLMIKPTSEGQK